MPNRPGTLHVLPKRGAIVRYPQDCAAENRQHRRALPTNSTAWRKLRAQVLREEPLCTECTKRNRIRAATQVDHVDGNAQNNARANLQGLCLPCHSRKTAAQDGSFGRARARAGESLNGSQRF